MYIPSIPFATSLGFCLFSILLHNLKYNEGWNSFKATKLITHQNKGMWTFDIPHLLLGISIFLLLLKITLSHKTELSAVPLRSCKVKVYTLKLWYMLSVDLKGCTFKSRIMDLRAGQECKFDFCPFLFVSVICRFSEKFRLIRFSKIWFFFFI